MSNLYIGLGSNLGNRREMLERAILSINKRIGPLVARSSFHETEPWGFESEHPFLNACIRVDTNLSPFACLKETQKIEKELGRTSKTMTENDGGKPIYHDRPIDIDLLMYDDMEVNTLELTLPHPLMNQRPFVMIPLQEILEH